MDNMFNPVREIKNLYRDIKYAWRMRNNSYIDTVALRFCFNEGRELFNQKIKSALRHYRNNDLAETIYDLFSAIDYLDNSTLWDKEATLAKHINDNKDNVPLTMAGMFISYGTSLGSTIGDIHTVYTKGVNPAISDPFFWGFLITSTVFGIVGWYQQKRLRRIVKEHKDYTSEFQEVESSLKEKAQKNNNNS
jgi:hypothetical protein